MRILEKEEIKSKIHSWVQNHPEINEVRIFGSRAKGTHKPNSDLDIIVTVNEKDVTTYAAFERENLQASLQKHFLYEIDLWVYDKYKDKILKKAIDDCNILIYKK